MDVIEATLRVHAITATIFNSMAAVTEEAPAEQQQLPLQQAVTVTALATFATRA